MSDSRPSARLRLLAQFDAAAGELSVGGVPASELVERFGSPLYVYDAAVLRERLALVQRAVGPAVRVLYSVKANPSVAVIATLHRAGAGGEVASAGEIYAARAAGLPGPDLHFAGPGKTAADLELACREGVGVINLESAAEYEALVALTATRGGPRPRVALRVNPAQAIAGARMVMGGAAKKFGVDEAAAPALARRIVDDGAAELVGLHVYAGTQCFDAEAWLATAAGLLATAARLEDDLGVPVRTCNFGGGFGFGYYDSDPELDLEALGRGLRALIDAAPPGRDYYIELGRFLTAPAGVYLTRVTYLKESGGRCHAILDGGMHQHAAAAGVGAVIRRTFPVVRARAPRTPDTRDYSLGGPLCTPADQLADAVALPELQQGDVLAFLASGAYGLTFSSTMFLSHPLPPEVLVDGGVAHLVREGTAPADWLRGQHLPPAADACSSGS
ncbi:MAG: diaminopimelate decarboxylase [Planctomycetota bacterium]